MGDVKVFESRPGPRRLWKEDEDCPNEGDAFSAMSTYGTPT
jgi:hypothetical protein